MLLAAIKPSRIAMVRMLIKYTNVPLEVIATLDDSQVDDLATRLKHKVVVSEELQTVPQEISLG